MWLDEAWVASSVRTGTWEGLFFYPGWLQTSPPLFLLGQQWLGAWAGWRAPAWLFGIERRNGVPAGTAGVGMACRIGRGGGGGRREVGRPVLQRRETV